MFPVKFSTHTQLPFIIYVSSQILNSFSVLYTFHYVCSQILNSSTVHVFHYVSSQSLNFSTGLFCISLIIYFKHLFSYLFFRRGRYRKARCVRKTHCRTRYVLWAGAMCQGLTCLMQMLHKLSIIDSMYVDAYGRIWYHYLPLSSVTLFSVQIAHFVFFLTVNF